MTRETLKDTVSGKFSNVTDTSGRKGRRQKAGPTNSGNRRSGLMETVDHAIRLVAKFHHWKKDLMMLVHCI